MASVISQHASKVVDAIENGFPYKALAMIIQNDRYFSRHDIKVIMKHNHEIPGLVAIDNFIRNRSIHFEYARKIPKPSDIRILHAAMKRPNYDCISEMESCDLIHDLFFRNQNMQRPVCDTTRVILQILRGYPDLHRSGFFSPDINEILRTQTSKPFDEMCSANRAVFSRCGYSLKISHSKHAKYKLRKRLDTTTRHFAFYDKTNRIFMTDDDYREQHGIDQSTSLGSEISGALSRMTDAIHRMIFG